MNGMSANDHCKQRIQQHLKAIIRTCEVTFSPGIYMAGRIKCIKDEAESALAYLEEPPKREKFTLTYSCPERPVMTEDFQINLMNQFPGVDIEVVHLYRNKEGRAISDLVGVICGNETI